jgi:CRISPR/Cas system CSM-associated protein Csm4 (group 5 of RAMP superfamily)
LINDNNIVVVSSLDIIEKTRQTKTEFIICNICTYTKQNKKTEFINTTRFPECLQDDYRVRSSWKNKIQKIPRSQIKQTTLQQENNQISLHPLLVPTITHSQ